MGSLTLMEGGRGGDEVERRRRREDGGGRKAEMKMYNEPIVVLVAVNRADAVRPSAAGHDGGQLARPETDDGLGFQGNKKERR